MSLQTRTDPSSNESTISPVDSLAETIRSYDRLADQYADRYAAVDMSGYRETFLSLLPTGGEGILDAGCGPGRDCAAFEQQGIDVVGLDLSSGLLRIAEEVTKRAAFVLGDIQRLPFKDQSFRGVWACASLVHSNPDELQDALREFRRVLVPGGAFFASVTHGAGVEWRDDHSGGRRWFQYYKQSTLERAISEEGFDTLSIQTEAGVATGVWINVFARTSTGQT